MIIRLEFSILNKFEKEEKVIELHKEGKTLKDIAPIVHMSFRDISRIIKTYDKKIRVQSNQKENNQYTQIKKPSKSSLAFKLFREGKELTDVAIDLEIPLKKLKNYGPNFLDWKECMNVMNFFRYADMIYQLYYQ